MFTQLFGHYLLNNNIITGEQLSAALEAKNNTRVRLGAMAIDAGYMNAAQVEEVHEEQKRVDKRIGDIAVEMGFLTNEQVFELVSRQKTANIVLGQTLIDLGYITNQQFEDALCAYKASSAFAGDESGDATLAEDLVSIFDLENDPDKDFYIDYIMLLTRNAIRFIGDDFVLAGCTKGQVMNIPYLSSQELIGKSSAFTAIGGDEKAFSTLAARYAVDSSDEEDGNIEDLGIFGQVDEFVEACVGEFLNLQNGLFAVNMSNAHNVELDLTPQDSVQNAEVSLLISGLSVNLHFSFGTINFIIQKR